MGEALTVLGFLVAWVVLNRLVLVCVASERCGLGSPWPVISLQPIAVLRFPIPPSAWPNCEKKRLDAENNEVVGKDHPSRKSEKCQRRSAESEV